MNRGFAVYRTKKANNLMPYHLALLGEVYGKAGQAETALVVLAEALDLAQKTGERSWEAELYRLKGELTLQQCQGSKFKVSKSKNQSRTPSSEARSQKRKLAFTKPSRLPGSSKPNPSNCGP